MTKNKNSWYNKKWGNKTALKNKDERRLKYSSQDSLPDSDGGIKQTKTNQSHQSKPTIQLSGVVAEVQRLYVEVVQNDAIVHCELSDATLPNEISNLVVGDRVYFDYLPNGNGRIQFVLPRKTKLSRLRKDASRISEYAKEEHILAANIDTVVIVASAISPRFHPSLVDRYLIMCEYGHIDPVICINKIDLVDTLPNLEIYSHMGIPVVYVSASSGKGLDDLLLLLKNKYSVFTGKSGVGKSTIINNILGRNLLATGDVGGKGGWGRHTTTVSTLNKLDENSFLIDTPGIRSLDLWEIDKETIRFYFSDFDPYYPNCKFSNCSHTHEPDCAVKWAVEKGLIRKERYASYIRMMED